jgi:hypothetical protein
MNHYKIFLILIILSICIFIVFRPKNKFLIYFSIVFLLSVIILSNLYFNSPDDEGYFDIYNLQINNKPILFNLQDKDILWLFLAKLINYFIQSILSIYILAVFGFLIKAYLIFKTTDDPFEPLLLYVVMYFQIHDLTQLRIAFASSLFLCSIYYISNGHLVKSLFFNFFSLLSHSAVLLNPIIYLIKFEKFNIYRILFLIFLILIVFTIFPSFNNINDLVIFMNDFSISIPRSFEQYLTNINNKVESYNKYYPLILIPLTLFLVIFKPNINARNESIIRYSYTSILLGYFCLWIFSDFFIVGGRFFEFYLTPIIFLAGFIEKNMFQKFIFYTIVFLFLIRYFIISDFFL